MLVEKAMSRCIATIGFRNPYVMYLTYFLKSLEKVGNKIPVIHWRDELPPGSPTHQTQNYAFKCWGLKYARERFDVVLWLDCSCYFMGPVEPIFERIERDGHFFIVGDDRLGNWTSDGGLKYLGIDRDEAMKHKLISGTCYGFDFRHPRTQAFFEAWMQSCNDGFFAPTYGASYKDQPSLARTLSADLRCQGHRSDEASATMIAHRLGMATSGLGDMFGGGMGTGPEVIVKSGYNLAEREPL